MSLRHGFIAVAIAFSLVLAGFLINRSRPKIYTEQAGGDFVRATGKCADATPAHLYSVVHEYEMSKHAQKGVICLDCHQAASGQEKKGHHRFVIQPLT